MNNNSDSPSISPDKGTNKNKKSIKNSLVNKFKSYFVNKFNDFIACLYKRFVIKDDLNKLYDYEHFLTKNAYEIVVPRSDIVAISCDASFDHLKNTVINCKYTRIIVYDGDLDNIIGFVHLRDLLDLVINEREYDIQSILRQHINAPRSIKLIELLKQMQLNQTHISVIVDEYGGNDGIVTIEDIFEEIVGDISDEHDDDSKLCYYRIIKPGTIITDARLSIDELKEIMPFEIDLSKYSECDTIGGMVMHKVGAVPSKGMIVNIENVLNIKILDATSRIVKKVKIKFNTN